MTGLKRSTYYYQLSIQNRADKYSSVKAEIAKIFHETKGRYGYRRVTLELRNNGICVNHKTVQRLMKELGLICLIRAKKYKSYKGKVGKVAPNIINREFNTNKANQKWVTDVTEFALLGKKVYLSPILDLYNREIISFDISDKPVFSQVQNMISKAFNKHPNLDGLILHSDQGWQYQMRSYQSRLKEKGIIQSMSRKGNCLDNSVIENFFGILKSEMFYKHKFGSIEQFKKELVDYIHWYNTKRIKGNLKGLSPVQFRTQSSSLA